jgi:hypothetical protein
MMPSPDMGAPVPVGPSPAAQGGADQPNPETMKKQLVMLLSKAKEMAEANGVNFSEVVAEVEGNKAKSDVPLPRPPSPSH